MTKKEKLFLIDGNSYCYRAFYAIKELRNSKGKPTNAVYGFILMLKKLLEKEKVAVVPGVAFGDDNTIRISYATSMENIEEGLKRTIGYFRPRV